MEFYKHMVSIDHLTFPGFLKGLEEKAGYQWAAIPGNYSLYVRGIEAVDVK